MSDLAGRHALVTGGGAGIGAACALALAGAGARVTITGRREGPLRETAARDRERLRWAIMDVADEASVVAGFREAADIAPVDILIANAGVAETAPLRRMTLDFWRNVQRINADGAFLCVREAIGPMAARGWGRIVAIASVAGQSGFPYGAAYCASKHAVIGLARAAAAEHAKDGVTVNALCPGYVATAIVERSVEAIMRRSGHSREQALATLRDQNPNGRLVEPEEVAEAALWLCSEGARSVNGQAIQIAGGRV